VRKLSNWPKCWGPTKRQFFKRLMAFLNCKSFNYFLIFRRVSQLTNDKKKMSANANIARNVLALDCIFLSSNTLRLSALPSIPKMTRDGNRYLCKYHSNSEPVGN